MNINDYIYWIVTVCTIISTVSLIWALVKKRKITFLIAIIFVLVCAYSLYEIIPLVNKKDEENVIYYQKQEDLIMKETYNLTDKTRNEILKAEISFDNAKYEESFFIYRKLELEGNVLASLNVAFMYSQGLGVEKSDSEMMQRYNSLFEKNNNLAILTIVSYYFNIEPRNFEKIIDYLNIIHEKRLITYDLGQLLSNIIKKSGIKCSADTDTSTCFSKLDHETQKNVLMNSIIVEMIYSSKFFDHPQTDTSNFEYIPTGINYMSSSPTNYGIVYMYNVYKVEYANNKTMKYDLLRMK